jgi:hypothetical protein
MRKAAACIAQLGFATTCWLVLDRILSRLSSGSWKLHRYYFVAQPVRPDSLCKGRGADVEVRLCRKLEELPVPYPRPDAVLEQRVAQGATSFAAFRRGELAGFLWLLQGDYLEDEVRARYRLASPRLAWDFDVWVRPENRLGAVFGRLWDEANSQLRADGVQWSCSRISAFNPDSLRAHGSNGAARFGSATFLRCGQWQWMLSTLAPYVHLSRGPAACPQLRIDPHHPLTNPAGSLHAAS